MKRNLFENKYEPSSAIKIVFVDIVCFLLVCIFSIGFCYSYFSDNVNVSGDSTMAHVSVQYQYGSTDATYAPVNQVYAKVNNGAVQALTDTFYLMPGDNVVIVGRAVNTSSVGVYVLAKLEIISNKGTETIWYNIGTNDPQYNQDGSVKVAATPSAEGETYETLSIDETTGLHTVGAGILGYQQYKELAIPYRVSETRYENGDAITSINLTLHVHQKDYLDTATDFINLYKPHATGITEENPNGFINSYTTESIYATHYITGNMLSE